MTQPSRRKSWRQTRTRGVTRLDASRLGWQNKTFGLNRGGAAAQTIGESDVEPLDMETPLYVRGPALDWTPKSSHVRQVRAATKGMR